MASIWSWKSMPLIQPNRPNIGRETKTNITPSILESHRQVGQHRWPPVKITALQPHLHNFRFNFTLIACYGRNYTQITMLIHHLTIHFCPTQIMLFNHVIQHQLDIYNWISEGIISRLLSGVPLQWMHACFLLKSVKAWPNMITITCSICQETTPLTAKQLQRTPSCR